MPIWGIVSINPIIPTGDENGELITNMAFVQNFEVILDKSVLMYSISTNTDNYNLRFLLTLIYRLKHLK